MPLRLDIKRQLSARSDRVKSVDMHPTEPWVLAALYNGKVYIWNYNTQDVVKQFEITDLPVRTAKFVVRKQWVVAGSDDMFVTVHNFNTMEKVKRFEAHTDYIRSIAVHPTLPVLLTSSDDMLIKLWDWDKGWENSQTFEGHTHYVMMVAFNPKDPNTFATASLDKSVKVWGLNSATPYFTLEGHDKGVNCLDYYEGGDRPYLISGADDKTCKIWDYQTKTCVQTLEGHTHNVACVGFLPGLPLLATGSEDGTVRMWHSTTYRLENTLNYGMERVWAMSYLKGTNNIAFGYDEGAIMIKIGREDPVCSMDSSGKVLYAKHNEVFTANVKTASEDDLIDGERIPLAVKELGSTEIFPQSMTHNTNGRFVVVCGDGEHIIYTALNLRNKAFGSALDFVWSCDKDEYAVRESTSKIKVYKNFKERTAFAPAMAAEGLFGGPLMCIRSGMSVIFYEWEQCRMIQQIDVDSPIVAVYWSDGGDLCTLACEESFYLLRYDEGRVVAYWEGGGEATEEGIEDSFALEHEVSEKVNTARFVGDCFVYTNHASRLNYVVGGKVTTLHHLDRPMYLLGFLPKENRLYLIDKDFALVSFALQMSVLEYQTAIVRGEEEAAAAVLPSIPASSMGAVATFLDSQGRKELALELSPDPDFKFELAVQLGKLDVAYAIALQKDAQGIEVTSKWRQLGDLALAGAQVEMAEECMKKANDLSGLLLLYSSLGKREGMLEVAALAHKQGKNNIAFMCFFTCGLVKECADLLCETGRVPEAAFFARTYAPTLVAEILPKWKQQLIDRDQAKIADSLADPTQYPNLFPDFELGTIADELLRAEEPRPASDYPYLGEPIRPLDMALALGGGDVGKSAPPPEDDLGDLGDDDGLLGDEAEAAVEAEVPDAPEFEAEDGEEVPEFDD